MTTPIRYTRAQLTQTRAFTTVRRPGVLDELGADADIDLFNVSGPVFVTSLFGIVTVVLAGAALPRLRFTEPDAGAPVNLSGIHASVDGLAVNNILSWAGTAAGLLLEGVGVGLFSADESAWAGPILLSAGVISLFETGSVAATGTIDWYISYLPLVAATIITAL